MTDPIADMLARIRNAIDAKHSRVDVPLSKLKMEVARILKEEGYINNFLVKGEGVGRTIRIFLRYDARGTSTISSLQRVSRPGRRVYMGSQEIPQVLGGYGINIVSTPRGLMTGKRARREKVGGEVLASVY
jgi:small subunit ribosomal protein S8